MKDEAGPDAKVLCVPAGDARWEGYQELTDVPEHLLAEIHHFFEIYKALEPQKESDVRGWDDRDAAEEAIEDARRTYANTHGG
jgi:inorganic pyrophosphatase